MSENKSLYQLVEISQSIKLKLLENAGEVTDEISNQLMELEEKLPDKCDGYKSIIEDLNHEAELWRKRSDQFKRVAETYENHAERLKASLLGALMRLETDVLEGHEFKAKLVKSRPKVLVDNDSLIPGKYKKLVQAIQIDKEAIMRDMTNDIKVDGCHLEEAFHVRFYPNSKGK